MLLLATKWRWAGSFKASSDLSVMCSACFIALCPFEFEITCGHAGRDFGLRLALEERLWVNKISSDN